MKMTQDQIIQAVNDKVIDGLKDKGLSWFRPWKSGEENQPMNRVSRKHYKGFNIFLLNAEMIRHNYSSNQWLTYKQCAEKGGQVSRGSKSTDVYFWKIGYFDAKTKRYLSDKDVKSVNLSEKITINGTVQARYKKTFSVRYYKVFNVDQCEGIDAIEFEPSINASFTSNEMVDSIVDGYISRSNPLILNVSKTSNQAYYSPSNDLVVMPKQDSFVDSDSYYKTLFHELAHSTGHQRRLNRKGIAEVNYFGSESYAQEELVAEISSMYLTGLCDLNPQDSHSNSQAYINGWVKKFEDEAKECFYAMQQATKCSSLILG
jgi:antirestriction protein ArdC